MSRTVCVLGLVLLAAIAAPALCMSVPLQNPEARNERLIFEDTFDKFDVKTWKHEITLGGGGNWEFQLYHNNRTNSYVRDGTLFIRPTLTREKIGRENMFSMRMDMWGSSPANLCTGNAFYGCERIGGAGGNVLNPIQSARIRTAESFSFRYGRVEVRAKMPYGDWLWPAIWLLPTHNVYGDWPASGEIDIIESRGNGNGYPGGVNQVSSALHWGPHWPENGYSKTYGEYKLNSGDFSQEFHVFGLVWTETEIKTYVDTEANVIIASPSLRPSGRREAGATPTSTTHGSLVAGTLPSTRSTTSSSTWLSVALVASSLMVSDPSPGPTLTPTPLTPSTTLSPNGTPPGAVSPRLFRSTTFASGASRPKASQAMSSQGAE